MTKQDIWNSIITPGAKARIAKKSFAEQLAAARAQASLRHDQSDIQDAFAGDRHYPESKNHKGHES